MDLRHHRLQVLHAELAELHSQGRRSSTGSPEQMSVLQRLEPVLGAILSLSEELEELPTSTPAPRI